MAEELAKRANLPPEEWEGLQRGHTRLQQDERRFVTRWADPAPAGEPEGVPELPGAAEVSGV